jgi:hypothetical protein
MRAEGLDVAAITDHSRWATAFLGLINAPGWTGIDATDWRLTATLADTANDDGSFVALRGFEWSDFRQGHMNVWGSRKFTDPLRTFPTMGRFWRWLESGGALPEPDFGAVLAGFNHPGTGRGRFARFRFRSGMVDRLVTFEIFNKTDEYLFRGLDKGRISPLCECLDAGWRVGLIGVTDEHGTEWGRPVGKGRAGLYVPELTRRGVADALLARRVFASRVKGLRLDAALSAGAVTTRMGTTVAHTRGTVRFDIDLDGGPTYRARPLSVQILRPGRPVPAIALIAETPTDGGVLTFDVDLDRADGDWVVLRVSDPEAPPDPLAPAAYTRLGRAVAYASPWWLTPIDA